MATITELYEIKARHDKAVEALKEWVGKQGHDRCHYYPDIFNKLCKILGIEIEQWRGVRITAEEFQAGCKRFQEEEFGRHEQG